MRALKFDGTLWLDDNAPMPIPEHDEALLSVRLAGICNTDLELTGGMYSFSGILGHEFVADVVEGPHQLIGKRVVGEINIGCGSCDFCQQGIVSQCRHRAAIGIHKRHGAFADYLTLPVKNIHTLPANVSDDSAVFVEPLAAALQVLDSTQVSPDDRVIVLGAGKLGMLVAQVLKLTGADLTVIVRRAKQKQLLDNWGIPAHEYFDVSMESADIVVDCTGQAAGFADALKLVKSRGTIILKSTYKGTPEADLTQVAVREINVVGSRCGPFSAALRLLEKQLVEVESLIEGYYTLKEGVQAMQHATQPGIFKVLLATGERQVKG